MSTAKYNYVLPPMVPWNEISLKIDLEYIAKFYKVMGDMKIDNGHSFSYSISVFFPQKFQDQVIKTQFAPYDAIPG